jgi:hypothetical protein
VGQVGKFGSTETTQPDKKELAQYKEMILALAQTHQHDLQALPKKRLEALGIGVLIWLLPSISLLAFGYLVAWVYSGF